jgi:hypothetical protein
MAREEQDRARQPWWGWEKTIEPGEVDFACGFEGEGFLSPDINGSYDRKSRKERSCFLVAAKL